MKILKGNYGECRFCDNMDTEHGLPSLEGQSWDLCLTDPPYGVNYKNPSGLGDCAPKKWRDKKVLYNDEKKGSDYSDWCFKWGSEIERICENMIFTPGNPNLKWWLNNFDIYDILVWYKRNCQSGGKSVHLLRHEFILILNKTHPRKLIESVFDIYIQNGFLREDSYAHPAPKEINLWWAILNQSKPTSVLDPFLGSGTTAEVCESLGIPWLGYEIMEEYAPDIEKRIKRGIHKKKQQKLDEFWGGEEYGQA